MSRLSSGLDPRTVPQIATHRAGEREGSSAPTELINIKRAELLENRNIQRAVGGDVAHRYRRDGIQRSRSIKLIYLQASCNLVYDEDPVETFSEALPQSMREL